MSDRIRHDRVRLAGFVFCCLFALFAILGTSIALGALAFVLILAWVDGARFVRALAGRAVVIVTLCLGAYVLARAVVAANAQPALATAHYAALWPWLSVLLFPLVAWFVRGGPARILLVLGIALAGMALGMLRMADWQQVQHAITDRSARTGFGLIPLEAALYIGTALLGWLVVAGRMIGPGRFRPLRIAGWVGIAALLAQMLFLTQSRTSIYSLALILPLYLVVRIVWAENAAARRNGFALLIALAVVIAIFGALNREALTHRVSRAVETLASMQGLQRDQIQQTSIGKRVVLYDFAVRKWWQRPLFGWGPGVEAAAMLPGAPIDEADGQRFPDLHSGYLEVLVRFGGVGFVLTLALAGFLGRGLWRARARGALPRDIGDFLILAAIHAALFNASDFQLTHVYNRFYTILLLGVIFSVAVRERRLETDTPPKAGANGADFWARKRKRRRAGSCRQRRR